MTKKIKKYTFSILFENKAIQKEVDRLAEEIKKYSEKEKTPITLLAVAIGGVYFAVKLSIALQKLKVKHYLEIIRLKSYSDDTSRGEVTIMNEPCLEYITGRRVIIVEDIIDEGKTIEVLKGYLNSLDNPPKNIRICSLIVKRNHGFKGRIHYCGFKKIMRNVFLLGYGLDYRGLERGDENINILASREKDE